MRSAPLCPYIMLIVFTMVYTMTPVTIIFFEDSTYRKLGGKADR